MSARCRDLRARAERQSGPDGGAGARHHQGHRPQIGPASEYQNGHSTKFGFGCIDAESAVKKATTLVAPGALAARRAERRVAAPADAQAKAALPNPFDDIIAAALQAPGASAESVAAAIAFSPPFLKALRSGMVQGPPQGGLPTRASITRTTLAKAISAATASTMY